MPSALKFSHILAMPSGTLKESTDDQGAFVGLERSLAKSMWGTCLIPRFMVTLPVVSKRKGKIFWKPKVEPQFFWVQDNCWHFVLCGCGVDIECL